MKKFARWGLAFAAVMSMSASAMAVPNNTRYSVTMKNGTRNVDCGWARFSFLDVAVDLFGTQCISVLSWYKPGLPAVAPSMISENVAVAGDDCEYGAEYPSDTTICDYFDPHASFRNDGWDVRWQRKAIVSMALVQDSGNGVMRGLMKLGSPLNMPYSVVLTRIP